MKVTHVDFWGSSTSLTAMPRDRMPEVAFAGRSNVGKSSLINTLLGRKQAARTSRTPGKTQTINFFKINERAYFVDLPGYGYAKVSADQKKAWGRYIESYLSKRDTLRLTIVLTDSRLEPVQSDRQMVEWLAHHSIPFAIVATKVDKISGSRISQFQKKWSELPGIDGIAPIPFSSKTGRGKRELWKLIDFVIRPSDTGREERTLHEHK